MKVNNSIADKCKCYFMMFEYCELYKYLYNVYHTQFILYLKKKLYANTYTMVIYTNSDFSGVNLLKHNHHNYRALVQCQINRIHPLLGSAKCPHPYKYVT